MDSTYFKTYFYRKVLVLNVFLTFVIVLLHSQPLNRIGVNNVTDYLFVHGVGVFAQLGVPMFFFISSLLFYKGLTTKDIGMKLQRRCKTLLVPYILWNILFVAIHWIMTHVSAISSMMNMQAVPSDIWGLTLSVIDSKYTPLWFVKNLMIYCCLAPVLLLLLRNKLIFSVCVLGSIAYNMLVEVRYESIWHWMSIYMIGAFVGYYGLYRITPPRNVKKILAMCSIVLFVILYILAFNDNKLLFLYRIITPLLIWGGYDSIMEKWTLGLFEERQWMHGTFFIYCTHFFVINIFQKIVFKVLPHSHIFIDVMQVVTPIVVFALLAYIATKLQKNKIYKLMTGGR